MKKLQRFCLAAVFTVVLTSATLAGEISTPGIAQPTPTPTPEWSSAIGENAFTPEGSTESNSLTDVALNLLQIMLSVF